VAKPIKHKRAEPSIKTLREIAERWQALLGLGAFGITVDLVDGLACGDGGDWGRCQPNYDSTSYALSISRDASDAEAVLLHEMLETVFDDLDMYIRSLGITEEQHAFFRCTKHRLLRNLVALVLQDRKRGR
jgi:hypothetical protein